MLISSALGAPVPYNGQIEALELDLQRYENEIKGHYQKIEDLQKLISLKIHELANTKMKAQLQKETPDQAEIERLASIASMKELELKIKEEEEEGL